MQKLVNGASKEFRQAWSAFKASDAGSKHFASLDSNTGTKVIVNAVTDRSLDKTGDGAGDVYAETNITNQDKTTGAVKEQVISVNFQDTGGTGNLADTFLDEFVHADQNIATDGTSTVDEDHALKDKEKKETNFEGQVNATIKKDEKN